ncbi:MAG: SusE domain-containing protein [Bacteroidales bacterium]|nr:SusE domain-containing protein [Bacteroidales bacterium]
MKRFICLFVATLVVAALSLTGCKKPTPDPSLPAAKLTVTPSGKIVLNESTKGETAVTLDWDSVADDATYTAYMAKAKAEDLSSAFSKTASGTSLTLTGDDLQNALLGMGFTPGSNAAMKFVVVAKSGTLTSNSNEVTSNIVLYTHIVELNSPVITTSATSVTLSADTKEDEALSISWSDASVEDVYVEYTLAVATDNSFENAELFATGTDRNVSLTGAELQSMLKDMGFKEGETASLFCRVAAEPADGAIESVTSDTKSVSVKLYEKPKYTGAIPTRMNLIGNGTEAQWDMNAECGYMTCVDEAKGIFEWTGNIINSTGTFEIYFDGSWNRGFRQGFGEFYWDDVTIPDTRVDNDYFRFLIPGKYYVKASAYDQTIEWELLEASISEIYVDGAAAAGEGEEFGVLPVPVKDAKGIFEGVVRLTAGKDFHIITTTSDGARGYYCHPSSKNSGTSWKLIECRESGEQSGMFQVPDTGDYLITIDAIKHTMTAVAQ